MHVNVANPVAGQRRCHHDRAGDIGQRVIEPAESSSLVGVEDAVKSVAVRHGSEGLPLRTSVSEKRYSTEHASDSLQDVTPARIVSGVTHCVRNPSGPGNPARTLSLGI